MKSLTIKDLAITEELDGKSMSAVRGGCGSGGYCGWKMPSCFPVTYEMPKYPSQPSTTTVSVAQSNNQWQSNPTGNGSAVFGGDIYANNIQSGVNYNG